VVYLEKDADELPQDENPEWKWGCINRKGREVIPPMYDFMSWFHGGIARVKLDSRYGLVDSKGRQILPPKYDSMDMFHNGLCKVNFILYGA